jgi:putative DNA primase/helicase
MLDLNEAEPARPAERLDLDAIVARLRETAEHWVPRHFPYGRRVGDEWRLANIRGDAPRKNGSCVIALTGDHAGDWIDFDGGEGGGPINTLEHAIYRTGRELITYAADLSRTGPQPKRGAAKPSSKQADQAREIDHILSKAVPLSGTLGERYLASRRLPAPDCAELLFHPDLTHWESRRGFPGLVALVRDGSGNRIALHRTYLADDGSAKAPVDNPRKMLASIAGGAVRLAKLTDDHVVGLAEGLETALSVMVACARLPVWATLSTSNLEQVVLPTEARKVVLLADHDPSNAGARAAATAAARLHAEGRRVFIAMPPKEGDDFNDLLMREGVDAVRRIVESGVYWGGAAAPTRAWLSSSTRARTGRSASRCPIARDRNCAPTTAISPAPSRRHGESCSLPTIHPGCSAPPDARPGWCATTTVCPWRSRSPRIACVRCSRSLSIGESLLATTISFPPIHPCQ